MPFELLTEEFKLIVSDTFDFGSPDLIFVVVSEKTITRSIVNFTVQTSAVVFMSSLAIEVLLALLISLQVSNVQYTLKKFPKTSE